MSSSHDLPDSSAETSLRPGPREPREESAGQFAPGQVLAGRYRIVAPLGRGGMGEVYRADDLRLGQPVALKFLSAAVAADPLRLDRLVEEVRIGRQISHPNVCRLYDIAEGERHHFLVMEYVDGEDLASLLRRIGRLPADKALEIARGIAAGLGAAHDKGIIHRDLKPANVLIDGRGHARIADFGLAALSGQGPASDMSGTPQYMAPEQLTGQGASLRSDVYAMGLVILEMLTGKRVFEAKSLHELRALHAEGGTSGAIGGIQDLDPLFKRVLERCLAPDPKDRWASAAAVLPSLPGGDPLQAAMRAGETPSPEMVAAASRVGDLRLPVAWACLLAVLLGLVGVGILARWTVLYRQVPFEKPPDVLVERAREILKGAGVSAPSADWAGWFEGSTTQELYCGRRGICFVYRGGAGPAESGGGRLNFLEPASGEVDRDDPPFRLPGMSRVILDTEGRLTHFSVVPPSFDDTTALDQPDWTPLLKAAGFDPGELTDASPFWTPLVASDTHVAWQVKNPGTDGAVRVEAAGFRGRAVDFRVIWEWDQPKESIPWDQYPLFHRLFGWWGMTVFGNLIVVVAAMALARRNLRLGRSDTAGALRIACFFLVVRMLATLLSAHHVPSPVAETRILRGPLARDLWDAVQVWIFYVALEPFARRRWPHALISWSRLLKGRVGDPLVGSDWLFGAVAGTTMGLVWHCTYLAPAVFGLPSPAPFPNGVWLLNHVSYGLSQVVDILANSVEGSLLGLFLLSLFRMALRRDGLAILALLGTHIVFNLWWLPGRNLALEAVFLTAIFALWVFTLVRFGLLALIAAGLFLGALRLTPIALDLGAWYGAHAPIALTMLGATAAFAFRVSLAGRPALASRFLDD